MKKLFLVCSVLIGLFLAACDAPKTEEKPEAKETETEAKIEVVDVPESITALMKERGETENALPELVVESPKEGETIEGSTVKIKLKIEGDLKGYKQGKNEKGLGNHVHVILDNQPYGAHYMWDEGFELRNVSDGEHTIRMFPSRPWHQSYKNEKAFKIVKFSVKNGKADESKPTTDDKGNKMADAKAEGVDVKESTAGEVDVTKPLLTYSRPKGTYKGDDAKAIMIDFWLSNAKLVGDGGEYEVKYQINDGEAQTIKKWAPVWVSGWKKGKNTVKLWLVKDGEEVKNGGYNTTTREITVE